MISTIQNQPNQPWFGAHSPAPVVWDPTPGLDVAHRFQVEGLGCRGNVGTLPMRASFREGKMKQIGSKMWNNITWKTKHEKKSWTSFEDAVGWV